MKTFILLLVIFFEITVSFNVELPDRCKLPLDLGKTPCKGGKKEIRYHFDTNAFIPLAFEYSGCGGNENNFKSESQCRHECVGIDYNSCAAGSAPFPKPETCEKDADCGPKGVCTWGSGFKICCDKKINKKVDADYNPKCPKGTKVVEEVTGGIPQTVVGKTCKSNHCPAGSKCVEGNYFATCCK